jgi:hypothetical protein
MECHRCPYALPCYAGRLAYLGTMFLCTECGKLYVSTEMNPVRYDVFTCPSRPITDAITRYRSPTAHPGAMMYINRLVHGMREEVCLIQCGKCCGGLKSLHLLLRHQCHDLDERDNNNDVR